jgi:hypothetical protein
MSTVRPKINFVSIFVLNLISKKMKKLYFLLACLLTISSFGQVFSEDFNYADNALLSANGWTAFSGAGTASVDVGASNGLNYTGYSGTTGFTASAVGNAARLDTTGEDVNKNFTTSVTSGSLYYTFLVNVTSGNAGYFAGLLSAGTTFSNRVFVKPSTVSGKVNFGLSNTGTATYATTPTDFDLNTTYLIIVKYDVTTTGNASMWIKATGVPATEAAAGTPEVTVSGTVPATVSGFFLRQYDVAQNLTIDGIRIYSTWFNATPCSLVLNNETRTCNATTLSLDTYTTTIPFTGGGTATYTMSATSGTISGDNPSTAATGNIIISGVSEGTNNTLTISGGCNIVKTITAPECKPINTLPFTDSFPYTVGNSLNNEQKWSILNTGDNIVASTGNLNYTGITSGGNSISFGGAGAESKTLFTNTTTGSINARMLVSVTDISGITADLTGAYFAILTDNASSLTNARLWVRKNGTQIQYGIGAATTDVVWDATLYATGTTQYLVLGYDFSNNTVFLCVNPTIGGTTAPTATYTPTAAITGVGGFVFRQDSATLTPTAITVDELTIDTALNFTLSNQSFSQIDGLKMYPNPAKNNLFIETALNSDINVSIINVLGKEVINSKVSNNAVTISGLTPGMYIVKITEEGKTSTKKLIIE